MGQVSAVDLLVLIILQEVECRLVYREKLVDEIEGGMDYLIISQPVGEKADGLQYSVVTIKVCTKVVVLFLLNLSQYVLVIQNCHPYLVLMALSL